MYNFIFHRLFTYHENGVYSKVITMLPTLGTVPPDYYERQNYLQRMWHDHKWQTITQLASSSTPKRILEIGCAAGHMTKLLARAFPQAHITGIDIYPPAIARAKKLYPKLTFLVANAQQLPFKSASFDLVICTETIEHVVLPSKLLSEVKRVLSPRGLAVIEMDSGSRLFRLVWFFWTNFSRGKIWHGTHLHPFTARELKNQITQAGFLIHECVFSHFGMAVSLLISTNR